MDVKSCPICERGQLAERCEMVEVEYRGQKAMRPSLYSVCSCCGSEQADASQTRKNKRDTMAFRKEVDGLLTGAEVRALRERLAITQAQAAQLFGGGPVAFSKYESDDIAQSEAMDKLLRITAAVPGVLEHLTDLARLPLSQVDHRWVEIGPSRAKKAAKPHLRLVSSQDFIEAEHRNYA